MLLLARRREVLGDRRSGRLSSSLLLLTAIGGALLPIAYLLWP